MQQKGQGLEGIQRQSKEFHLTLQGQQGLCPEWRAGVRSLKPEM